MGISTYFFAGNSATGLVDRPGIETTFWGYILAGHDAPDYIGPLIRWVSMFFGVSFIFASMGFWLVPASGISAEVVLFKLASSAFFLLLGVLLLQMGQEAGRPEVQVDMHRKELRFVQCGRNGLSKLVHIINFVDIGAVDVDSGEFSVLDQRQKELASLALTHAFAREMQKKFDCSLQRIH